MIEEYERRKSGKLKRALWSVRDRSRMLQWLIAGIACYALAMILTFADMMVSQPQIQIALWKAGNVTLAAWLGYQIDRQAFPYERCKEGLHHCQLRRAIVMSAAMLAIGLGL